MRFVELSAIRSVESHKRLHLCICPALLFFLLLLMLFGPPVHAEETASVTWMKTGLPLISITVDPADLWDESTGLMVEGVQSGETNPDTGLPRSANYMLSGENWIRPAFVSVIDPSGEVILSQRAGLALSGGTSRGNPAPSLKLIADAWDADAKIYYGGLENSFVLPFSHVTAYNDLKLRTGAHDANETNIRSAVMSVLCRESGYPGYLPEQRAIIRLNGDWYAICSIQPRYIPSWLARRFSLPDASGIEIIGSSEQECIQDHDLAALFRADLTQEENLKKLEQKMDMDDFLFYCALQILSNNVDWPGNNFKMWRYTGTPVEGNRFSDGRFRCLLYDSDLTWLPEGYFTDVFGTDAFSAIMNHNVMMEGEKGNHSYIADVLNVQCYRDRFVNMLQELLSSVFSVDHLIQVTEEQAEAIRRAVLFTCGDEQWDHLSIAKEMMKNKMIEMERRIKEDLSGFFHLNDCLTLTVKSGKGASVSLNVLTLKSGESGELRYYPGTDLTIHAASVPGYRFSHWLVNGLRVDGDTLSVQSFASANQPLLIEAVATQVSEALVITRLHAKGQGDWICLTNAGQNAVNLNHYVLTDQKSYKSVSQLPDITLESGNTVTVDCPNHATPSSVAVCDFNLKAGEDVCLWDTRDLTLVDNIIVPRMSENESYGLETDGCRYMYFPEP